MRTPANTCEHLRTPAPCWNDIAFASFCEPRALPLPPSRHRALPKVHVGNEEYIHLRVHEPLPHTNAKRSLHSVEHPKKLSDELKHFG
ncbi:unnamed protein product [Lampetra planeri]